MRTFRYMGKNTRTADRSHWGMGYLLAVILSLIVLIFAMAVTVDKVYADNSTGTVVIDALNVRSGAGTLNQAIGMVYAGESLTILGTEKDSIGGTWYRISYGGGIGYVSADYVTINSDNQYVHDNDFEAAMEQQGFPESYKPYLRQLHADYPEWVFQACHTNLDWSSVIERESPPGVSLVPGSSPASWKSMDKGAYDFNTGTYIPYDSGNWVTASKAIIKYYMDPRNFLNSGGIFQFLAHSYDGRTQTAIGLQGVLDSTFMRGDFPESGYQTYNDVLMDVGAQTGVNPYVLASMILVEQGSSGNGRSISGTVSGYEGYYNHFNIGAYASGGMDAVTRGLWYASQSGAYGRPWNNRYKSILGGAEYYSKNYVQNNKYTLYLKKFNVMNGLASVGTGQYMTNVQGAESEAAALRRGYASVLQAPMTFIIPVYKNMPEKACLKPTSAANNNNYLSSLTATGLKLSPSFGSYQTSYTLDVATSVNVVELKAKASSSEATIKGTGKISLSGTTTTAKIVVTAANGETRTYTVTIRRVAGGQVPPGTSSSSSGSIQKGVENTDINLSSSLTSSGTIRLDWVKSPGYKVDYYEVFRSTARYSGYGTSPYYKTTDGNKLYYINTKGLEPGNTYYYKIRGVRVVDGKKVYTQWSNKSWRTIKMQEPEGPEEPPSGEIPEEPPEPEKPIDPTPIEPENPGQPDSSSIQKGVEATTIRVSSAITAAGKIRLDWTKSVGYKVDYYEVFRSTARYSGYGTVAYYKTADGLKDYYVNTKDLKSGKTYYYKIRGVRMIDGKKVYTKWSNKSWRTV